MASDIRYAIKQGNKLIVPAIINTAITGVKLGGCGNHLLKIIQSIMNMLLGFNI